MLYGLPTDLVLAQQKGLKEVIERVKRLGFDFVEVYLEPPFDGQWKAKDVKSLIENYRLKALGHFTWYADLSSWYREVREAWIKVCKNAINFFNEMEIECVTLHTNAFIKYPYLEPVKDKFITNLVDSFKELEKYAKNIGIILLIENTGEKYGVTKLSDLTKLISELEFAKINLDIGHAFANNSKKEILKFIENNGARIYHFHFHDNDLKNDLHLPLSEGKIPWQDVIKSLKRIKYDKTITLEIFTTDDKIVKSLEFVKSLFV